MATKRNPQEQWRALAKAADDDEQAFQQAASVSVAEAERQLAAAGVDVKAERERGTAMRRELEARVAARKAKMEAATPALAPSPAPTPAPAPTPTPTLAPALTPSLPPPRPPWRVSRHVAPAFLLLAMTVGGVGGGLAVYISENPDTRLLPGGRPVTTSHRQHVPPPAPAQLVTAADHRRLAFAACDAQRWADCLTELELARALDPDGDDAPEVQAARQRALDALLGTREPGDTPGDKK
jgi:hypothetical protein